MNTLSIPRGLDLPGLKTRDLTRDLAGDAIAPFLVMSRMDMTGPTFPPHPHAGFSVATYILPESEIGFWNQDTLGTVNHIAPGSLHWTVAGAGLMHEETPERSGKHAVGFQIWIDHPHPLREIAPAALHITADEVPVRHLRGVLRRVVAGIDGDVASPLKTPVAAGIIDMTAQAGAVWTEGIQSGHNAFVWVLSGKLVVDGAEIAEDQVAFLRNGSQLEARSEARIIRFSGLPSDEAPVFGGPFVAATREQNQQFKANYQAGLMGRLRPFDQVALDAAFDKAKLAAIAVA